MKPNPDGSFPIPEDIARIGHVIAAFDKDKTLNLGPTEDNGKKVPVIPKRLPSVDIPQTMTPEHYYGMNLLPGHRIGEEYRQRYLDKLQELCIKGYITQEEFDKRADWVNAAQTSEQLDLAFLDLQSALLAMKAAEYISNPVNDNTRKPIPVALAFYTYITLGACIAIDAFTHAYWGVGILLFGMIFMTILMKRGYRKHG